MPQDGMRRRAALALGTGLLAGPGPARAQIRAAEVPPPSGGLAPEPGARLRVLRPARFVDPDEAIFNQNSRRFAERTGVEVRVDYVSWPDMPCRSRWPSTRARAPT